MALIKVTGYIDTDMINADEVDVDHPTGLSNHGFESGIGGTLRELLDDLELEIQ